MKLAFIFSLLLVTALMSSVSAGIWGYDSFESSSPTTANINVNNTQFFRGYTPTTLRDWMQITFDTLYCELTGCNMTGDLNVSGDVTGDYFIGDGSGLTNIPPGAEVDPIWTADKGNYSTTADIVAFGYYNSTDFVITDYFTKSDILGFGYYNSSDFSISDYFTSSEVLAFNYYNSTNFNITDYTTTSDLLGWNYYNSSDFSISDYYTKTNIDNFAYYNASDFSIADYSTTAQAGALYATIDEPLWSGNLTAHNDTWTSTYNATYDAYNDSGWIINWSGIGNTDTTYTAGSNLSLVGTEFSLDEASVKTWLDTLYAGIATIFDGTWASLTGKPTVLSNFTDDLGDRGYDNNLNFTNGAGYYNASDFNITDYYTSVEVLAFGYYNSTDFVITDYFTKTEVLDFDYYNSTDFSISDYFTGSEVLAFNYYNASNFNISDYFTSAEVLGFNYYNSTDFNISDYYTSSQIEDFGYYNSSNFNISDYSTTTAANLLYAPINYGDDWNKTYADTLYANITEPVALSLGNWSADKISYSTTGEANDLYVNLTGDTMTGALNMSDNPIYIDGITLKPLDEKNANIAGPAYGVYMTGPSGQNLPHLIIQSGGASQASVMLRSQMIVNEIAGFHNTTNATSCIAYMNEIGETLKIDCNTTTTGADLIVSDDMQVVGDVWIKDTDGQWHFMTRELNLQDELRNNLLLGKAGIDLVGTNLTITDSDNLGIAIIINRTETLKDQISDSVTIVEGTNTTPVMNTVTYQGSSNPILTRSTSTPAEDYANVARMLLGSDENPYASIGGRSGLDEFISKSYVRWLKQGALYESGFDPTLTADTIDIGIGQGTVLLDSASSGTNFDLITDGAFLIRNDGTFLQFNDIADIVQYSDGGIISNGKHFNVVCGLVFNDLNLAHRMMCVVQNEPTDEYRKVKDAEIDKYSSTKLFPSNEFVKALYLPVARMVIKQGDDEFEILGNGLRYIDVRGSVSNAGAPATAGIVNHDELNNLDYASAGHTGFLAADGSESLTANWNAGAFNITASNFFGANTYDYWNDTYATFNKTYADTLYYDLGNSFNFYNSTDFNISDYYLNSNPDDFINWAEATNGTLALVTDIPTDNSELLNGNSYWNDTYATFNKTYADGLYQATGSYLTEEVDPLWTANQSSYSTKTVADTLYAPINYGDDWNKTYADTLYAGIEWDYNQTTDALLQVIDWGFYNSSDFSITDYYPKTDIDNFAYYNASDFSITDYYPKTDIDNFAYYNASDFSIADYSTTTAANLLYAPINYGDDWNKTYADTLYQATGSYLTEEVDPIWTADKGNYSTKIAADLLYYGITNPSAFYNASDFSITDYYPKTDIDNFAYYNASDFSIADYYPKTDIDNFAYYNASDFSIADYSTTAEAGALYYSITNPAKYWNDTYATFNKTYADTLYQATGSYLTEEVDPIWTADKGNYSTKIAADLLYYGITNPSAFYNASDFSITDYYPKTDIDNFAYYNASDFSITDYYPKTDIDNFAYYNASDFSIADYSTTSAANLLYAPINYGDDWNKTLADTLYADISVVDNSSWNQSLANGLYVNIDGDDMTGRLNISNQISIMGNYPFKWFANDKTTQYAYIIANSGEFKLSAVDVPMNFYYGGLGANLGATMDKDNGNWTFSNNVSADYFEGDGSLLTNINGINQSWNQSLANILYYSITNPSGFYNSSDFSITDYYPKTDIDNFAYYNASDFSITDYYPKTDIDNFAYYNATDFSIADYSTTTAANLLYAPINYGDDWNKTYADTLYRLDTWDNFTGIPVANPSSADTTHLSTAKQIYDWAVGLFMQDLVDDTAPQLGADLDTNGHDIGATDDEIENIYIGDNTRIYFGDGQDASMYFNGTNLIISG